MSTVLISDLPSDLVVAIASHLGLKERWVGSSKGSSAQTSLHG